MEENRPTLTTFDFNSPDVELEHENILSKLYGKVKTAVSNTGEGDAGADSSGGVQEDYLETNGIFRSWYQTALDASGTNTSNYDLTSFLQPSSSKLTLTDTSDLSMAKNSLNDQLNSPSGSMDNITLHQSSQSLMNYTSSDLDQVTFATTSPAPTLSTIIKAPPTASVVITTATAQTSASTSTASSVGGKSSSNNSGSNNSNTFHLPHPPSISSNSNDHVHFSPSPTRPLTASDMEDDSTSMPPIPTTSASGGSNSLTLPMIKSKSVDSDTQSIATNFSISNTNSLGKIMARLRGQKTDKEFWMPDEQCKECYKCRKQFTMFRRKHHCRLCGQIFCSKCASHITSGKAYNQKGQVRICNFCYTEQCLENNGESGFSSSPATSRLAPSPSFKYELPDENSDNASNPISNENEPYQPVIPSQNPHLAAPMMQIPTTAVKKSSNANYGNENSTTLALEIGDHDALSILGDSRNRYHRHHQHQLPHHHYNHHHRAGTHWPSTTGAATPTNCNCNSVTSVSGVPSSPLRTRGSMTVGAETEPGGFKRLLDAGTSLLNARSRSNTTTSQGGAEEFKLLSRRASNGLSRGLSSSSSSVAINQAQQQQGCYMDHGGGMVVTENALSPFFSGANGGNNVEDEYGCTNLHHQDISVKDNSNNHSCDGSWHRPHSARGNNNSYTHQYSNPFWHGQSSSTTTKKLAPDETSPSAGSDNETYDVQLRAKRTAELRGDIVPLRKRSYSSLRRQSTSNSMGSRGWKGERRGHLQVNTSGLLKPEVGTHENWSPNSFLYPYSAYEGGITTTTNANSPIGYDVPQPFAMTTPTVSASHQLFGNYNNTREEPQSVQDIKAKLLTSRHRRVSAPTSNTELSFSALGHARKLLRQLMDETSLCELPEEMQSDWETVIMQLLIKMTGLVQPDVRAGDDMDVRHYVKIKKIPGGLPSDSFYVKGVMCSKNVAHKRMARNISEPRILILLFSLGYSRVEMGNQLLSIKPVISQEREHVSKLVGRIIALRPSLLLVKSTVSRLALEILLEANIPVVHNVKYSVIEAVARCTQASVITSVDKLQGDIFFGQCGSFEIRTFLHEWIPNRRKTLLVFGDCAPELGGTIVLRGGTEETLRTVKTVMDFMVFVVHNLKLETALLRDSFAKNRVLDRCQIALNSDCDMNDLSTTITTLGSDTGDLSKDIKSNGDDGDIQDQNGGNDGLMMVKPRTNGPDALHAFLKVYRDTVLSASQYVVFPPPYLLTKLKETQDKLDELGKAAEPTPHQGSLPVKLAISPTRATFGRHPGNEITPHGGTGGGHPSLPMASYSSSVMLGSKYELLVAKQHQLNCAWDAYLRESPDYVSPFYHQNIVVLYSNVCTVTTMPCYGPQIRVFEYYRYPSDVPLGQYLMDLFADALEPCPSSMCDYPTMNHYLSYAHGDARVNVITQYYECPVAGMNDKLLMWSYCNECKKATQVTRVSENTWNYSFGKFLELVLYQQGVHCRADICPHEMSRHHVRIFGYMDMSVGFQYETIDLLEVSAPPTKLFMLSQVQIDFKDAELKLLRTKINKFYQSIIERNKAFPYDLVDPQQLDECKTAVQELSDRSLGTKKNVLQILQNIYATTAKSDTLTINWVRRILYQEVGEWDKEYTRLIRRYLLFERELRKITTSQLRKMFPADTTNAPLDSSGGEHDIGNERFKRSSETTDLPFLGIALDGDDEKTVIGYTLKDTASGNCSVNTPLSMLPQLSSSPSSSPGLGATSMNYQDDDYEINDNSTKNSPSSHPSLLRPHIRRQLSFELNRELQLRFRVSDDKEEQLPPPIKTPGPTAAAMTPSRIPIPNINISSTTRPQLSPPIYDTLETGTLETGALNPRLIITLGGNKIPMAPLKVPSSFELNVSTPGLRMMHNNKDSVAHRNVYGMDKRIYVPSETRICVPPPPIKETARLNQTATEPPIFMQELHQKHQQLQDEDQYHGGLQTQSLQHIPSMFKSQYANNDSGRRALGSIRRRTTAPSSNNSKDMAPGVLGNASVGRSSSRQQQGPFKSRLPRKKTYIQVYTQANDLVKEDMDDEFLVSDLDDVGDLDHIDNNENDYINKSTSGGINNNNSTTSCGPSQEKAKRLGTGKKTPLLLPMPHNNSVMDIQKLAETNSNRNQMEEPMDYFSPQAPYYGTSGTSSSPVVDKERINQSVAAALASVPQTPFSMSSMLSATSTGGRPTSMLERFDTDPSSDIGVGVGGSGSGSGSDSNVIDNQLPLASDLLSSPAATSTSGDSSAKATPSLKGVTQTNGNRKSNNNNDGGGAMDDLASGKLPRNALIEKSVRRTIDLDDVKHAEKSSFMKTITNFLTDSGTDNLLPLENPMNPMEHVLPDSFVIVREDEPSTIIAYTLSCDDYLKKMKEIHNSNKKATSTINGADAHSLSDDTNTIAESFDDITLDQSTTTGSAANNNTTISTDNKMTQANIQETLLRESGSHMRYNFSDSTTKFFCKSFFTEQFDALRRQCGCDETYILSLASCLKWDPVGGKSGSAFLKTKDDRLLMKQMSRFELDAFLGFAPAYFQYLSKAFFTELPTVLAKIFGFYSIGYKNSSTGKSMRMDVLVMENLFYQRNVKKVFDLKGSMRNRHVESTGKEDEVLLDENLVELIFQSPLFIRAHSKEILRSSLHNDTLFLSGRNVMDYSLLVGIDEERHELVVGIVDFIRTFTWDKKLESWVKESVFLGGGGKEPTIVSPRLYRLRFRAAMERYFLMVPDVWALARQNRLSYPSTYHHHSEDGS